VSAIVWLSRARYADHRVTSHESGEVTACEALHRGCSDGADSRLVHSTSAAQRRPDADARF